MSPLVEVTGVGALIKPAGSDRYRPYTHGDQVEVDDADVLVAQGGVRLVDDTVASDAEEDAPQPGAIAVSDLDLEEGGTPVAELRRFASDRRINLHGASRRPEIVESIEAWMTDPEEGG